MEHIYQASGGHVHKRIDPQGRQQKEQLAGNGKCLVLLVAGPEGAEDECGGLPCGGHDDDPAEALAEYDGEDEVREGQETEEKGEGDGAGKGGRVGPLSVAGGYGDVAVGVGGHGYA